MYYTSQVSNAAFTYNHECDIILLLSRLRYFQLEDEALTQQALVDRISKHYVQEVKLRL